MSVKVPKILRPLELSEYVAELEGQSLSIWVNPPRALMTEFLELQEKILQYQVKLEEIVERSKKDGKGADLTADVAALDEKIAAVNDGLYTWFAQIWGQGETPETTATVKEFAITNADTDPALWAFVTQQTVVMIRDHREGNRKN